MGLTFRKFRNKLTGEVCFMPAGRYGNFLNSVKKLVNYIRYNIPRYYVLHLTLTVAENTSDVDYKHLHRVIQFIYLRLKRAESDFKYIAVKEVQERGAVHYHILCIYSKPYVFPSPDEIAKSWRLGFVKITAPKLRLKMQKIVGYLGKYIGKGYEYEALDCKKSFTASQIMQIYKLSAPRLAEIVNRYGMSRLADLTCTFRKVFIEGWSEESILGTVFKTRQRILLHEFSSQWSYAGVYEEPF
ncbi:MAG: hypothetical protein HZC11_05465 [Nitrospirae bacterium]|nr:hypothetical protein [Nitrospirota bacterium]